MLEHVVALARLAAPPGRDARDRELLVEEVAAQARQEAQERVALDEARAERVADHDLARARGLQEARHADHRVRAQLERIAELGADPAHDEIDRLEALDGLQIHAVVADREVRALDDAEAEIAREVRVLEVILRFLPRRQEHRERRIAVAEAQEALRERAEKAREPAHVALREHLGQGLRRHDAILERVARARRRLRAVAEHPPAPVRRAREVERDEVQVQVVAHADARARPQELRIAEHEPRRQHLVLEHALLAVEIDEQRIQEARALDHADLDRGPFVGIHQQREQVEMPRPAAFALCDERHAVLGQEALRLVLSGARGVGAHRGERVEHVAPARPDAAGVAQFVEDTRGGLVGLEQLRLARCVLAFCGGERRHAFRGEDAAR